MEYDVVAKNLLLGHNCLDCDHAATLAKRDFNKETFTEITGFSLEDIHEGAFLYDALFMCHKHHKILPRELSCSEWEEARE